MKKAKKVLPIEDIEFVNDFAAEAEPVEILNEDIESEDEEEDEVEDLNDYNDNIYKKQQKSIVKNKDIAINLDNYELLLLQYRPLILSSIQRIRKMHMNYTQIDYDDLYQESSIALYQAIENFDNTRGVFFGVYLKVAISNKLKCFYRNYLPHKWAKDEVKSLEKGKSEFKRILINISTLDDVKSYMM